MLIKSNQASDFQTGSAQPKKLGGQNVQLTKLGGQSVQLSKLEGQSVQLSKLDNGMIVPSLEGRLFCSRRDPVKESETWFRQNELQIRQAAKICILGLGAGFHIMHFDPKQEIQILELNPQLIEIFLKRDHPQMPKIQFLKEPVETDATILEFRPAWIGNEQKYQEISNQLKARDSQSLQKAAEKKDLWVLAEALKTSPWPQNLEISVKDIAHLFPLENQTQEAKIWRALRELVA